MFEIIVNPDYEYTVIFDTRSGSAVTPQAVKHGAKASLPAAPVREKHIFEGWFKTSDCNDGEEWDFDADLITSDTTVYAGWTQELSHEAELVTVRVNGVPVHGTLLDNNLSYLAACGEEEVTVEITASDGSRIMINGEEHVGTSNISLTGEVSKIDIAVKSESDATLNEYVLTVTASLSGEQLYFQRWDDVLSINHNPKNNGGRTITNVRWFKGDEPVGVGRYVEIEGSANAYRAEVEIGGKWHKVCHYTGTKTISIVAYPNPVSRGETLTLQLPDAFIGGKLSIYNMSGALIKSNIILPSAMSSLSIDYLSAGVYLFKVNSINGNSETVKVVVSE